MNSTNYFIKILTKFNKSINSTNYFVKILTKFNKSINSLLKRNLNKLNFLFEKKKILTFLTLKRIFVCNLVLLISFLSYLSAPHVYDGKKLVLNIENLLSKNLNLDLNLSDNYRYNFFPKPNFVFKDGSFLEQVENSGEIKIYISPKYLLFPNKIKIEDVIFNHMNFNLNKESYNYFINLLASDFSNFTLKIKNSNIFYKNIENDVLFINKIKKLEYFYDIKNLENILLADNEIFNIPYRIEIKDDLNKKKITSKINLDFVNLEIENIFNYLSTKKNGSMKFIYNQNKSEGNYKIEKNFFNFNYLDKSKDQNYKYNGFISLKPFFSEFSGNLNHMNLDTLLNSNSIIFQLLKTGILNNKNLNINSYIFSKQTNSLRDLVNIALNVKIGDGLIDINETKFSLKDYADFKVSDSLLYTIDNNLILDATITANINDSNEIFKIFQTPRNYRKEVRKLVFNLSYNFDQMTANLKNIMVDDIINNDVNKILKQIILKGNNLQNRIYIKNLLNKAIKSYAG